MRTMKKSKMICAGRAGRRVGGRGAGRVRPRDGRDRCHLQPRRAAAHDGEPRGPLRALGAAGCFGCHGGSDEVEVFLAAATPLPADHYVGGDASTHEIDGPRAECITCHPVAQE